MESFVEAKEYELAVVTADEAYEVSLPAGVEVLQAEGPKPIALGYVIEKHASGFLRVYTLRMMPAVAAELNLAVEGDQSVLRHLLLTPPIAARRREPVAREKGEAVRPVSPESVSNAALEAALETMLENKAPHEPQ